VYVGKIIESKLDLLYLFHSDVLMTKWFLHVHFISVLKIVTVRVQTHSLDRQAEALHGVRNSRCKRFHKITHKCPIHRHLV